MSTKTALAEAEKILGLTPMARELDVTYQAIRGWMKRNKMPDTEYSGRSHHAVLIERMTDHQVTVTMLLGHIPLPAQKHANKRGIEIN